MDQIGLIRLLWGPATHVAVMVPLPERKLWMPSPVGADSLEGLAWQHREGAVLPRLVLRRDGSTYLENRITCLGAYCLHREEGAFRARWVCFDVDSAQDHKKAVNDPAGVVAVLLNVLEEAGLEPVLERSHGGGGWHVWCIFAEWQDAAFLHWLGQRVRDLIKVQKGLGEVEAFPKQASIRGEGFGNLVALPFPGQPRAAGGGLLHWPDLGLRGAETVRLVPEHVAAYWRGEWARWERAEASATAAARDERRRQERRRQARPAARGERAQPITCGLAETAEALGIVTRRAGGVLLCDCPRHQSRSRESLHVEEGRGWICRACHAGDGAERAAGDHPWSLVRWCRPGWEQVEIGDFLRALSKGSAVRG